MLILLDTWHIDLLERTRWVEPDRYARFTQTWKERGCVLVFTSTEAKELGRYADTDRRAGRYHVLADLAPIRTDLLAFGGNSAGPRMFVEREIVCAMVERGVLTPPSAEGGPFDKRAYVLPWCLQASQVGVLRKLLENRSHLELLTLENNAARHAAAAEKMEGQAKRRGRVRDLPNAPPPAEVTRAARSEIERHFARLGENPSTAGLPPVSADVQAAASEFALGLLDRIAELGPRAAVLEELRLSRLKPEQLSPLLIDDLVEHHVFEWCVRNFARDVLNLDEAEQTTLAQALELSDCPGFWLQMRLRRRIPFECSDPRPSHHSDAERLAYLPYVDLLFTDKQMAQFVHEIRNSETTPTAIREARPPVRISAAIDALEGVISC